MNPPIYRITGMDKNGNRQQLHTNNGPAFYLSADSARRGLIGIKANGYQGRWYAELRVEQAYPDWRAVDAD